MRLFTAITLPQKVKRHLAHTTKRLQKSIEYGKFSDSGNYHITLVFMGDIKEDKLPTIHKIMDETAGKFPPMFLTCEDIGFFEKRNRKILYYNVGGQLELLSKMQRHLYQNIHAAGLCRQENSYTPHITFARNVKCDNIFEVENSLPFSTGEITLMHSTRVNDKLTYLPIYKAPFNGIMTVDRLEGDIAVCEHTKELFSNIDIKYLPKDIESGSKVRYNGLDFEIDHDATKKERKRLHDRFTRLKGG